MRKCICSGKDFHRREKISLFLFSVSSGVDWSVNGSPSSHCWFPLINDDPSKDLSCEYISCTREKSSMVQCGSCSLIIHLNHLTDLNVIVEDILSPCRPSFVDSKDISSKIDEHFWSKVSIIPTRCEQCEGGSLIDSHSVRGFNPLLIKSSSEIVDQLTSMINCLSDNFTRKKSVCSVGIVCLWCYRSYHQSCWEQVHHRNSRCDYGIFR